MASGRKMIDCGSVPSDNNCTLKISGPADDVVRAAALHAVDAHGHKPGPELESQIRAGLKDE